MTPERTILHVDMDAFFASVEALDDPALRGRPVLVGYRGPRGVVAAASYEARTFGCHSAQPMSVALRLCPDAAVVPVRFDRYRQVSRLVFAAFEAVTPLVEPLSIDEAFLDVTGSERLFGDGVAIARLLRQQIKQQTGLTASVGVAPNKFLAKLASDMDKPDGLTVITRDNLDAVMLPLPIGKIWGIGPVTAERLQAVGIRTVADLRRAAVDTLVRRVGDDGSRYHQLAFGIDDRPVQPDREAKSIGQEQTFGADVTDPDVVRAVMLEQAQDVAARLRRHELHARTVTVKIRFGDFQTVTRRTTLPRAVDATQPLWETARALFDAWATAFRPVRLIGVTAGTLAPPEAQLDLFPDPAAERQRRLEAAVDGINARFGKAAVRRGGGRGGEQG